jgi:4-amino-4-deoxy-L-arabinose transferase-like glycosyltransferase
VVAGDVREGLNRLGLVLVLAAFAVPLFIGLGSRDLGNDEAIYSYAVESVLTTGDWLSPRSSPNEEIPFLEKPPLKFWIVAAPIHAGLLPYNEFGLRFWDALFGALAFLYVFLIGQRLAGAICGAVALLVLFAHGPLLFEHGLRSNNMDAALVLAYAGGIFHFLRWSAGAPMPARRWHIAAVGGWFVLGFMTKFVAALFLPLVLAISVLVLAGPRRTFAEDWRWWVGAAAIVVVCVVPWFLYQYLLRGDLLWRVMFGEHVVTRFTQFADPAHVRPWHFYVSQAHTELSKADSIPWVAFGLGVLLVQAVRCRTPDWVVIALWLIVPVALISLGSSKLYHYFYPYLAPLALAAGAGVAWVVSAAGERLPISGPLQWRSRGWVKGGAWALTIAASLIAFATAIDGGVWLNAGDRLMFRNTSIGRPLIVATVGLALAAGLRVGALAAVVLLIQLVLPTPLSAYAENLRRLKVTDRPLGSLAECVRREHARRSSAGQSAGVYAPVSEQAFLHPYFYYLRGTGWHASADASRLREALMAGGAERPVVIDHARYTHFLETNGPLPRSTHVVNQATVVILLPGTYAACGVRATAGRS